MESVQVHHQIQKMAMMLDISLKNREVLIKYLRSLHNHLRRNEIYFKPRTVDESCVQEQYLENMGK